MNETGLVLPEKIRLQILADAELRAPEEGCGLVGGKEGHGEIFISVTNRLHSPTHFQMDPLEMLRGIQQIEDSGLELIAIYHSHPGGEAGPSEKDRSEFFYPGVATVIASPNQEGIWGLEIFWL